MRWSAAVHSPAVHTCTCTCSDALCCCHWQCQARSSCAARQSTSLSRPTGQCDSVHRARGIKAALFPQSAENCHGACDATVNFSTRHPCQSRIRNGSRFRGIAPLKNHATLRASKGRAALAHAEPTSGAAAPSDWSNSADPREAAQRPQPAAIASQTSGPSKVPNSPSATLEAAPDSSRCSVDPGPAEQSLDGFDLTRLAALLDASSSFESGV